MLAWQQQSEAAGIRTAILSNMGDTVLDNIEREFHWLDDFDVLVWSYQLQHGQARSGHLSPRARAARHAPAKRPSSSMTSA